MFCNLSDQIKDYIDNLKGILKILFDELLFRQMNDVSYVDSALQNNQSGQKVEIKLTKIGQIFRLVEHLSQIGRVLEILNPQKKIES